ncbi:hypothetical protein ABEX38_29110 [Priestia megaterium]
MDKETIYNVYVIEKKTVKDIIKEHGISYGSFYYYLEKYDISRRSDEKEASYRNKEWLENEYINENKSLSQIAQECEVSVSSIASYLQKFEIPSKKNAPAPYKDKDWLYDQRVNQNKTYEEIAKQCNVDRKNIEYYAKKFEIKHKIESKKAGKAAILVDITCHGCGSPGQKTLSYIEQRKKANKNIYFCSRECADEYHSNQMKGENNPNFEGEFHGDRNHPSFSVEAQRERALKKIEKWKENGYFEVMTKKLQEGHKKFFETPEGKAKRQEIAIKSVLSQKDKGFKSSLEIGVAELLDELGLKYEEQKEMYFWVVDFYLPEYDLVIEANGDYWHANPMQYNESNMTSHQKSRRTRDAKLKAYIQGVKRHKFLAIWEYDFYNNIEEVIKNIREYTP